MDINSEKLPPGTIIFVDMNGNDQNHLGVTIDEDFWQKAVEEERLILPWIELSKETGRIDKSCLYRVLGNCQFRKFWQTNDPSVLEPNSTAIIHYHFRIYSYVRSFDLHKYLDLIDQLSSDEKEFFFPELYNRTYISSAIADAKIIYQYQSGKKFQPDPEKKSLSEEEKFLRLLELAIPNP
jgi:hypothetical protein